MVSAVVSEWMRHNDRPLCSVSDVEYIIEKLTDRGALVVDPFVGAGSVPAACKKLGRRWIGCEIDSRTAWIARGRVAA